MRLFGVPLFLLAATRLLADGAPGGAPLEVVLAPTARVSGRVLDATGRPLAGATVRVAQLAVPDDSPCDLGPDAPCARAWAWELAPTPADGRFLFDHLEPGLYRLSAEAEGFLNSPDRHLELAAGELQVHDLLLEPGAVLRGRVLGADGRPLAGVHLIAVGSGRSHLGSVESGAAGRFTVAGLEPGRVEVSFGPPDLAPVKQTVEVGPGENRADLVYAVPAVSRSTELRGRVVDAAGRPVPDARVVRSYDRSSDVLTGADGAFALPAEDGLHELQAEAAGYAPASLGRPVRVRGASVEGLELRLSPGVALHVRVPPAAGGPDIMWIEARQRRVARHADRGGRTAFDAQGWVTIAGLGPGRWRVRAGGFSPTGLPEIAAEAEVEIAPGEREASVELAAPSLVSGRVLDPDGAPLPYARLGVYHERQGFSERHGARADGGFALALPSGTYRLAASAPGYASVAEPLRVEDAPVGGIDLRLGEPVRLAGRVTGLDAAELLEVEVMARQGDLAHRVPVDPEGEFELPALGPGPWEVSARVGPRVARTRVRLDEHGAAAPVEIAFPDRLLTLAGRVTGAAVPASLDVELRVPGEVDRLAPLPLDGAGRFRLAGLAPGSYELSVRDWVDDRLLHRGTFALTADRTITVPLRDGAK